VYLTKYNQDPRRKRYRCEGKEDVHSGGVRHCACVCVRVSAGTSVYVRRCASVCVWRCVIVCVFQSTCVRKCMRVCKGWELKRSER